MSRHTDRLERSAERHDGEHQVWSRADYQAGRDEGGADMLWAFQQALDAVGIGFGLNPYVELRGDRVVLLFKVVLDIARASPAIPLPAMPNQHILAPANGEEEPFGPKPCSPVDPGPRGGSDLLAPVNNRAELRPVQPDTRLPPG